jgi:hypothetical protein
MSCVVDAHKPLHGGAENQRRVAAPAVRVVVVVRLVVQQRADHFEPFNNRAVALWYYW